mmetsp:Transcript_4043/g.11562  ORF Transcript_4043/g.11562 Transcript_4043/m.11562 type:complete len:271 (-) Transcript_4043:2166-2978(-)
MVLMAPATVLRARHAAPVLNHATLILSSTGLSAATAYAVKTEKLAVAMAASPTTDRAAARLPLAALKSSLAQSAALVTEPRWHVPEYLKQLVISTDAAAPVGRHGASLTEEIAWRLMSAARQPTAAVRTRVASAAPRLHLAELCVLATPAATRQQPVALLATLARTTLSTMAALFVLIPFAVTRQLRAVWRSRPALRVQASTPRLSSATARSPPHVAALLARSSVQARVAKQDSARHQDFAVRRMATAARTLIAALPGKAVAALISTRIN